MYRKELKEKIEEAEKIVKDLKSQLKKIEGEQPFERVPKGSEYFRIGINKGGKLSIKTEVEADKNFVVGENRHNYFFSKKRAEEVLKKIVQMLKAERIRDQYFPNYVPNWTDVHEEKSYVFFDHRFHLFNTYSTDTVQYIGYAYYPDREVAEEICERFNREFRKDIPYSDSNAPKEAPNFERVPPYNEYFWLSSNEFGDLIVNKSCEIGGKLDESRYSHNNYFRSQERADEIVTNIMFLLKLERLFDLYCSEYVPNWEDETEKWYVVFDNYFIPSYEVFSSTAQRFQGFVHFPSKEIANKVCELLDDEFEIIQRLKIIEQ